MRDNVVPRARKSLQSAETARKNREFSETRMHLTSAAETIKGLSEDLAGYKNMIDSGGKQTIMAIQFYRDVAIAAVTGAVDLGLSVGQKVAVASVAASAGQTTELATKALGGEKVTSKDFVAAAIDVGTAAGSTYVGGKFGEKMRAWFGGISKKLGSRIAGKAVDRYVGPTLGPKQRATVIKVVTEAIESRIANLAASHFSKVANSLAKKKQEPDWNWWENIIAPMVGGDLEGIVKEAAREVQMSKQTATAR